MRKFAIVLTALAASLLVGTTASAQSFSSHVNLANNHHRGGGSSVDIRIGGGGFGIGVHTGNRGWDNRGHGGWDNRGRGGWDNRGGWDRRGPVYRYPQPVYRYPSPIYRDHGYDYDQRSTITVQEREVAVDRYGQAYYTGRTILRTAWYDRAYGGYVYRDQYGRLVRAR